MVESKVAIGVVRGIFSTMEAHAPLTQAAAEVVTALIAALALYFAIQSLNALRRQTEASISLTTETFRPIMEVLGGTFASVSKIEFINKGNGAALNFRWRVADQPDVWRVYQSNIIAPQEKGMLSGQIDWQKGLVFSYNAVAHRDELLTYVQFGPYGAVSNQHEVKQGAAFTRLGWTLIDAKLALPGFRQDFVDAQPFWQRMKHRWRLLRGKERRL